MVNYFGGNVNIVEKLVIDKLEDLFFDIFGVDYLIFILIVGISFI